MSPTPIQTLQLRPGLTRTLPRAAPVALLVSLLACLVLPTTGTGTLFGIILAFKVVAILSACSLSTYLEDSVQSRIRHRRSLLRFVVGLGLALSGIIAGIFGVYLIGVPLRAIGDGGATILAILCATLWMVSACTGTLLVLLLDSAVRSFAASFRSRINLAVMGLVGLTAAAAYGAAQIGQTIIAMLDQKGRSALTVDLGFGTVWTWDTSVMVQADDLAEMIALGYFVAIVILAMPAVMSACGKLADSLMRNLDPLQAGFEAAARGELDVRLPESGTPDFAKLSSTFNEMLESLRMAKRMERAFGSYISRELLDQIRSQHGEANLEPSLRMATVFFADIRGFTSMSERINPKQLLAVLNRFYEAVAQVVEAHQGFLVQYIGDAVVVVFNGPIEQPDHADRATRCAIDVQKAVCALNDENAFPEAGDLSIGIGIATGPLVAGNLGDSEHLLQYTVLGDTVNQAARMTGLVPPGEIWVNQRAAEMIDPGHDPQAMAPIKVKGRARPLVPNRVWPRSELTDVTEVHSIPPRSLLAR